MASGRFRFGSPLSSKRLWFVDRCLVILSLTVNETLTWLSSLPILRQESFWRWQCSDMYIISTPPPSPTSIRPSLISLMVSVNVKHHKIRKEKKLTANRAQELCKSGSGRPGLAVPHSPHGRHGCEARLKWVVRQPVRAGWPSGGALSW